MNAVRQESHAILAQNKIIEAIQTLLKKYHAESAILFGSYARKEANPQSDIDVIIIGGPSFELTDVFSLADDLHRATGKEVDVYEISEVEQASDFFQVILKEGVRISA